MAITPNLLFLYSGSASVDPSTSLGGQASSAAGKVVLSQTLTGTAIPGVTTSFAAHNPNGAGALSYLTGPARLSWTPSGGSAVVVPIPASGRYTLGDAGAGYLIVDVAYGSLPGADTSTTLAVTDALGTLLPQPPSNNLSAGGTDYVCVFIVNLSTVSALNLNLALTKTSAASILLGSDFAQKSVHKVPAATIRELTMQSPFFGATGYVALDDLSASIDLLGLTLDSGLPTYLYSDPAAMQQSDGVSLDLPQTISNPADPGNILSSVAWDTSLGWPLLPPGYMVSFWLKRTYPAGTPATGIESLELTATATFQ